MPSVPPPPRDALPGSESRRVVAIVVLGVLLAGQLVFTLMGLLGFGLGGGSALEFGLFVVVAVGGLSTLLWLLSAVIGRRIQRPRRSPRSSPRSSTSRSPRSSSPVR